MMLTLKKAIEKYFQDNWVDTAIWIYGYTFDATGETNYIKIANTPLSDEILDTANECKRIEISLEVSCYGANLNEATETADNVLTFLRAATTFDVRTNVTYDVVALDNDLWMQSIRVTAFSL